MICGRLQSLLTVATRVLGRPSSKAKLGGFLARQELKELVNWKRHLFNSQGSPSAGLEIAGACPSYRRLLSKRSEHQRIHHFLPPSHSPFINL